MDEEVNSNKPNGARELDLLSSLLAEHEAKVRHHQTIRTQTANILCVLIVAAIAAIGWDKQIGGSGDILMSIIVVVVSGLGFLIIMLHHRKIREIDHAKIQLLEQAKDFVGEAMSSVISKMTERTGRAAEAPERLTGIPLALDIGKDFRRGLWSGYVSSAQALIFVITGAIGLFLFFLSSWP